MQPASRKDLDVESFIESAATDPRNKGEGPCGNKHHDEPVTKEVKEQGPWNWAANQFGVWANCPRCGLRMGYWPLKGRTGRYREMENPEVVRTALANLRDQGWEKYSADLVRAEIKIVEGRMAKQRTSAAKAEPAAKQTARRFKPQTRGGANSSKTQQEQDDDEMDGVQDLISMSKEAEELKEMVEELRRENKKLLQSAAADKEKTKEEASGGQ